MENNGEFPNKIFEGSMAANIPMLLEIFLVIFLCWIELFNSHDLCHDVFVESIRAVPFLENLQGYELLLR